jgi:hypothetical protein
VIWLGCHHAFDIVYESPDKDGFSTVCWSRDHTGKWMDPRDRIYRERKMCKDYWFSKYNRIPLHYSVSMAAAATDDDAMG